MSRDALSQSFFHSGSKIQDSGFRIQDSGFRIQDSGWLSEELSFTFFLFFFAWHQVIICGQHIIMIGLLFVFLMLCCCSLLLLLLFDKKHCVFLPPIFLSLGQSQSNCESCLKVNGNSSSDPLVGTYRSVQCANEKEVNIR